MTLKLDKKPKFKTLKFIFKKYYKFSITDFFSRLYSLKKFTSKSWKQIKNQVFLKTKSKSKFYFNSLQNKVRFTYINQLQSCLLYTRFAGKRRRRYLTDKYNSFFNMKMFNLTNKSKIKTGMKSLIYRSKGHKYNFFKNLILYYDNRVSFYLFRHYFVNSLAHGNFLRKKNILHVNNTILNKRHNFIVYGSVIHYNKNKVDSKYIKTFPLKDISILHNKYLKGKKKKIILKKLNFKLKNNNKYTKFIK